MLKSMRKSKNRYFYHIFVSPGDASGVITLNVVTCMDGKSIRCLQIVGLKAELNMSINAIMEKNGFESCCSDERKL